MSHRLGSNGSPNPNRNRCLGLRLRSEPKVMAKQLHERRSHLVPWILPSDTRFSKCSCSSEPPHSFSPPYRWGKTVYPHTLSPHLTDGEKQCTPHSFSPPYRWRERVNYTLFPLQYGGNLKVYPTLFFPIVIRWGKRVYPLHSFFPS